MIPTILRFGTGVVFLIVLLSSASAQQLPPPMKEKGPPPQAPPVKDLDDYRQYFKKPQTAEDYWKALQFEIDVGQYDLAAQHLRGLLAKPPTEDELLQLEAKYGMSAFLKLRALPPWRDRDPKQPRWSNDEKANKQALDDIEQLIDLITKAVKAKLADRDRIVKFVRALSASPEEAAFALKQLYSYRAFAVAPLIDEMRAAQGDERRILRNTLKKLPADVIPPLLAALDSNDPELIVDVISVFMERGAKETVPHLWFLSASPAQPDRVRAKATEALAYFLSLPAAKLTPARLALTREAERYYQHQVVFVDPKAVVVWRWDKATIVQGWPGAATVPATKAEEYYGLRFAREALVLDPEYKPAQEILLSIALDKALENADLSLPLAKISPSVQELASRVSPDVLVAVLERALKEQRTTVILGCVRVLGERMEARASKPTGHGEPALVRALDYGDKRVAMSAAESLLRMPAPPSPAACQRVLEILRLNLAVAGQVSAVPKALVASGEAEARQRIAKAVAAGGYEPIPVGSGREALRRLNAANDISAIVLEATLPDPGLASFLAQVRADVNASRLPVVLIAVPDNHETRDLAAKYEAARTRLAIINGRVRDYRSLHLDLENKYQERLVQLQKSPLLNKDQAKQLQLAELASQHQDDLKLLASQFPEGEHLEKEVLEMEKKLQTMEDKYSVECQLREEQLKRWLDGYPTIAVVSNAYLDDSKRLQARMQGEQGQTETKPLSEAEQKDDAEKSMQYFARMARGEITGYDVKPFAEAFYTALRSGKLSEKGQADAIDVVASLSASRSQLELASLVLDEKRTPALRLQATDALVKHIQRNSVLLNDDLLTRLRQLYEDSGMTPELKAKLAVLEGSLRPGTRTSGERLRDYQPPPPVPPMPPGGMDR